jgi:fibronectin-binding autotransporter adhesin
MNIRIPMRKTIALALFVLSDSLLAQTTQWTGSTGNWFTAGNWNNGVPTSALNTVIRNGGTAQIASGGAAEVGILTLGSAGNTGALNISDGSLTAYGHHLVTSTGWLSLSGSSASLTALDYLTVNGGATVGNGATLSLTSGTSLFRLGNTGAIATFILEGVNSLFTSHSRAVIGNVGTGTFTVRDGAMAVFLGGVQLGDGGGQGTVRIEGTSGSRGRFETDYIFKSNEDANGVIIFDGGILTARSSQSDFLRNFDAGDVTINSGGAFIDSNGFNIGIDAVFSGLGGLNKVGEGILTLTGSNSYAGGTWVQSGTLVIGPGGVISHASTDVFVGTQTGSQASLVIGSGTVRSFRGWVAAGDGSTGSVTVNGGLWDVDGALMIGATGTGRLMLNSGTIAASLGFVGGNADSSALATITGGSWIMSSGLTVGYQSSGTLVQSGGLISNANAHLGSLSSSALGVVTVSGGTWNNASIYVGTTGTGRLDVTSSGVVNASGTVVLGANSGASGTLNIGTGGAAGTLNGLVAVGSGTGLVNFNHTGSLTFGNGLMNGFSSLSVSHIGSGTTVLTGSNSYAGGTRLNAGVLSVGANNNLGASLGALFFDGGTLRTTDSFTMNRQTTLGSAGGSFEVTTGTLTQQGAIGGTGWLAKFGNGTLMLTGSNSYSAGTNVRAGTLDVNGGIINHASGTVLVGSVSGESGTLAINNGSVSSWQSVLGGVSGAHGVVNLNGGSWINSGTLQVGRNGSGALTITSGTFSGASIRMGSVAGASGTVAVSGGVLSNSALLIVGDAGTGHLALSGGVISGSSAYIGQSETGIGTVVVSGGTWNNSASLFFGWTGSGSLLLDGGLISATTVSFGQLGNGSATVSSGTLTNTGNLNVGGAGTGDLQIEGGSVSNANALLGVSAGGKGSVMVTGGTWANAFVSVGYSGTGTIDLDGGLVTSSLGRIGELASGHGTVTVTSGTWENSFNWYVGEKGTGTLLVNGGLVTGNESRIGAEIGSSGTATVSSGVWQNFASLLIGNRGQGTLTITGGLVTGEMTQVGVNGSGTGALNLNGGVLQTRTVNSGVGVAAFSFNGGTLRATGAHAGFVSGFGSGVTLHSGGAFIDSNGYAVGSASRFTGSGGLTKLGAGTLTLTGTSDYTGATEVKAGTLSINGVNSGTGAITVASGATLAGTGTLGGTVNVENGGILATGNSIGTLTVGGANFAAGSLFSLEGDGAFFDSLVVNGDVTLQEGALLSFNLLNPLTEASYTLITAAGGLDGTTQFTLSGLIPAGYILEYAGTSLNLVLAPEIGAVTVTPTDTTIITGGTTSVVVTVGNDTPSGGADLDATVAGDGTNVSGTSTVVVAPHTTGTASPDLAFSSTTVGVQTGTVTVTDPNATNSPQSGTMTVTVMGHADPLVSGTMFNLGYVHEGYAAPVMSNTQLVTNGTAGAFIVDLKADEVTDGNLSINGISGVAAGDSANVSATLATGQGVGVISGTYTYVFGDDSNLPGASNNVGSTTFVVTGEVYSGQGVWITSGSGSWGTFSSGFGENWLAGGGSPGLDAAFASTDTATFGTAGSGIVTLDGASPSLRAVTFDNADESYTLLQGSGGTLTLNGGTNAAVIENLAGYHFIAAPINLASNTLFTVASATDILTIGGTICGSGNVEVGGAGRTIFTQDQSYVGATTVTSGVLASESLTGGAVNLEGGLFSPGDAGAVSQITVSTLNLNGGGLEFDLATPGASDAILVTGTTTLNAATQFVFLDAGFSEGIFTLVQSGTLVNFGDLSGLTFTSDIAGLQGIFGVDGSTLYFRGFTADTIFTGPVLSNYAPYLIPTTARFLVDGPVTTWPENLSNTIDSLIFKNGSSLSVFNDLTVTSGNFTVRRGSASIDGGRVIVPGNFNLLGRGTFIAGSEFAIGGDANINGGNLVINNLFNAGGNMNVHSTVTVNGNAQIGGNLNTDASEMIVNGIFGIGGDANINNASSLLVNQGGAMNVARATNIHAGSTAQINGVLTSPQVNNSGLLKGTGVIDGNLWNNGIVAPGNSPGTLTVNGNYVQTSNGTLQIELGDLLLVSGNASLAGRLQLVAAGKLKYGQQIVFLQAGSSSGEFDEIVVPNPSKNRGRVLTEGGTGTLLIAPTSYTLVAETTNQRNVAKALDVFIPEKANDRETVSIALDLQSAEQYPAAFDQIAPTYHETVANITLEQAFVQSQQLNQRFSAVRLGARGFQAIGIESPLVHDKDGKSVFDAKDAKQHIPQSEIPNPNWSLWAMGNGLFGRMTGIGQLPNQNFNSGGFLVGADYTLGGDTVVSVDGRQRSAVPALAVGLYGGYQYTWADAGDSGNTQINSALFGGYASYTQGGFYADGIVGGGYNGYRVRRGITFSTIDRTARSQPNGGQFNASLNLGYDWELGKFTLGPIAGMQYAYAGIAPFSETGADSLDLRVGQQNVNSLRTTFGGRVAYTWNVTERVAIIPEVRMFWQHEFLNNPRNISSALDGGSGPTFGYETSAPARDSVFAGAGVSAQFGERWNAFFYWNVDFGRQDYFGNSISGGLNWKF